MNLSKIRKNIAPNSLFRIMTISRLLYIFIALAAATLIFWGASEIHQANLANIKTIEDYFLTYADRYEYNRYAGDSKFNAVLDTIFSSKVSADKPTATATSVPVLLYHRISAAKDPYNVSPARFKSEMFALKKAGYTPVSIYDYVDFINGKKKLPAKSFLLTFDDGTKDSYYPVQPILKALDFHATMFVITRYSIDNPAGSHYYLSTIELKQMEASGVWDLEAHTKNGHTYYPISTTDKLGEYYPDKLWLPAQHRLETDQEYATRVYNDMLGAKEDVEKVTHKPVVAFAFPFGDTGEDNSSNYVDANAILTKDVSKLYQTAMLQTYGGRGQTQNYYGSHSTYSYRIEADASWPTSTDQFMTALEQGSAKTLPYKDNFSSDNGWLTGDGSMNIKNRMLNITSIPGTTGGSALLDGTNSWTNYTVTATAQLISGTSFDFTARNHGSLYRIGCDFSPNYISVERQTGDQTTTVLDDNFFLPINQPETLGVSVDGQSIKCLVNGQVMVETTDATMPLDGGPGFTVWDPLHPSQVEISNMLVTPAAKLD